MIRYYAVRTLMAGGGRKALEDALNQPGSQPSSDTWENVGGQLMTTTDLEDLKTRIRSGELSDWPSVHQRYQEIGVCYKDRKISHARAVLSEFVGADIGAGNVADTFLDEARETAAFILEGIRSSRRKDYDNPFRNITYSNSAERDAVMGSYEENEFIQDALKEYEDICESLN
jgi:hypothetical protein